MTRIESRLQKLERAYPAQDREPTEAELEAMYNDITDVQLIKSLARMQLVRELTSNDEEGGLADVDDGFVAEVDRLADEGDFENAWRILRERLEDLLTKEISVTDS